ncbi:hypothetical protein [Mycobacterium sp. MUNTM1]
MRDHVWDGAVEMGVRNQRVITLAKNHCTRMEFVQSSGQGMAEEATGLPINAREVRCPVARGNMIGSNLEMTVPMFYRQNCVGCAEQRPSGLLPTLAGYIASADEKAVAEREREVQRKAALRTEWEARAQRRRGLMARCDDMMATALADIGQLDVDPAGDGEEDDRAALARLRALAERAAATFTPDVIAHGVELVERGLASPTLLDPLRIVALSRPEFGSQVVRAAVTVMRRTASGPAGRCLADLAEHAEIADLDERVCRSAVALAGSPMRDPFSRRRQGSDPVSLLAVAAIVPDRLVSVLKDLLPGPQMQTVLHLPPGAATPRPHVTQFLMGSAAGAVRILAGTHPSLAAGLVDSLVLQLASDEFERFDDHGLREIERALAVMFVLDVGDVSSSMVRAGARGSGLLGERLLRVLTVTADLVAAEPYWRETGDPVPDAARAASVTEELFEMAMGRLGGDWGGEAIDDAAELIERLAKERPVAMHVKVAAILGAILELVDAQKASKVSPLTVIDDEPPALKMMTAWSQGLLLGRAIGRLGDAVKFVAANDPVAACNAVIDVMADERDGERGADAAWYLLEILGKIGAAHGTESGVLQAILPALHTYIVGSEVGTRARAIDTWVAIARRHPLPSALEDLLPALTADPFVMVIRSVLKAAETLIWSPDAAVRLLAYAALIVERISGREHAEVVKDAIRVMLSLSSRLQIDGAREVSERKGLEAAASLGAYDLHDVLHHNTWGTTVARSARMASLRLSQAAEPAFADFSRRRGDSDIEMLLACGPGLTSLPAADLTAATLTFGPDSPVAAAEFVEVAWRAGRLADAVAMMSVLLEATPDQRAYAGQRSFLEMLASAVRADATATAGGEWGAHADDASAVATALVEERDSDSIAFVINAVRATLTLRRLLMDAGFVDASRPAESIASRAGEFSAAGEALSKAGMTVTPTGAYLRSVAGLCEVVSHLLRAQAAALNADTEKASSHGQAVALRCDLITADITERLGRDDPIGAPLLELVAAAKNTDPVSPILPLLAMWAQLPLPVTVVRGPEENRFARRGSAGETPPEPAVEEAPVAVVLASLDGRLITGPEVLRDQRVYELSVRVQPGEWPQWADRMDGELLSHLTPAEITVPTFSWSRGDHVGDGETYEQSGSVTLRFTVAAGKPAPPLMVRLTWSGEVDGKPRKQTLDVAGHRELRLRPYDETRDRATDYPVFDERLIAEYDRLARAGFDDGQLRAFCRLFTGICRAGLAMTWERKYRRGTRVTEREFHDDLFERLLANPELGGRVERGNPLALGYLDVRHDGITAELKVERKTPVTRESAPKYVGQPTQYAAADGAQLSILAILDMSSKELPIGTPENYLFALEPRLHGLDNPEAPSLVEVLIVNGNLPTPSSWSRKKTPVHDTPGQESQGL